jgi:Tfp pilus assembly protein PilV
MSLLRNILKNIVAFWTFKTATCTSIKLKASSLIETIIAMVILVSVFSTGIVVYHKVMSSSMNLQKIKAQHLAFKCIDDTQAEKSVFDAELDVEGLRIVKKVSVTSWSSSMYHLKIAVLNDKKDTLNISQKIIYVED